MLSSGQWSENVADSVAMRKKYKMAVQPNTGRSERSTKLGLEEAPTVAQPAAKRAITELAEAGLEAAANLSEC